jgi:hypothetical protein
MSGKATRATAIDTTHTVTSEVHVGGGGQRALVVSLTTWAEAREVVRHGQRLQT